jgi:putative pyruvate formate lyase activating enzyme
MLSRQGRDMGAVADKLARAEQMLEGCHLCPRGCRVDRGQGVVGRCGCDAESRAYFEGLLWGEEAFITPSYALFFAGCNLSCAFCYAAESNRRCGAYPPVDVDAVADRVRRCQPAPVSFSLIGGEPTVHLATALRLIAALPPELPIVWNSNFYFSTDAAELLAGAVTVFVADLHFGNDACADAIAGAEQYLQVVTGNLRWAREAGALVVRHLVLPGHLDCCTLPALRWLASELPEVPVHVMTNYLPPEGVDRALARMLSEQESDRALELARSLGLRMIE